MSGFDRVGVASTHDTAQLADVKRRSAPAPGWRPRNFVALAAAVLAGIGVGGFIDLQRPRHDRFTDGPGALINHATTIHRGVVNGLENEYVTIRSTTGLQVSFRVLRPDNGDIPVPTILLLAGRTTGRNAVSLVGDPGEIAVVAMDYPYDGPDRIRGIWEGIRAVPKIRRALLDTPPAVSLVADWLSRQRWFDPQRVELLGGSIGVPFAAVAGAVDERFRRVWLVHGGADNRAWLFGALHDNIANETLRRMAAGSLHLLAHGPSFDSGYWVSRIAPRPVVVIGARDDRSLTPENIEALYEAAGEPRRLVWTTGGHVTRSNKETIRQILDIVRAEMEE